VAAALLVVQMVLGGLVSSRYAGLACPEWPTCNGGLWFPSWRGTVGVHLLHRWNAVVLLGTLAGAAWLARDARPGLRRLLWGALGLGVVQVAVGITNVLTGIPVEVTGLHSALAASLVLTLSVALRDCWRAPMPA
jgi:cytochrome c oxidase assembly protein subunit 15